MKRKVLLGLGALLLVGWSTDERRFGGLRVTATGRVKLRTAPRPYFEGPGAHIGDVAFLSRRVGLVVTSGPSTIERTVDGGNTWRKVLRGPRHAAFAWLAPVDAQTVYAGALTANGRPVLYVSRDGGLSWDTMRPRLRRVKRDHWASLRPTFVTPMFAYTVPDPADWGFGAFATTRDGGRTWQPLRLPKFSEGIQFLDARHGFAAGSVPHRCDGAAWRTDDGGSTWTRVFCGRVPLAAVQFLDARRGFVAGGWAAVTEHAPSGVVYATTDGGVTWQRRYVNPRTGYGGGIYPIVELRFLDAESGWARTGQCKCCPSGRCAGEVLVTRDGGRSWARRGSEVELATVGLRDAWALPNCGNDCDFIVRTPNAGRTWRPLARSDLLLLSGIRSSGGLLSLTSEAGRFVSSDGRRWHLANADVLAARPGFSVERSVSVDRSSGTSRYELVAHHGPRVFRFAGRAASEIDAVAVADANHAYAIPSAVDFRCGEEWTSKLFVTSNGGRSWVRRPVPFLVASLAAEARRVAAVGLRGSCTRVLALSSDGARTWRLRRLPRNGCIVTLARDDVWLGCGRKLLVSRDRGGTWTLLDAPRRFQSERVAAAGRGTAWSLVWFGGGGRLFRTTDSGRSWVEQWPRLPTP